VTPFEWTRRRLHHVPASFFVSLAAKFLKWQKRALLLSEAVCFLTVDTRKKFATQSFRLISR
jgi:hypothetical protein